MPPGDLRFYRSSGDLADTIIADVAGPFVHVELDMGDGTGIGELSGGLKRYPIATNPPPPLVTVWPIAGHTSLLAIKAALVWAEAAAAAHPGYGWLDVLDAGLHVIDPHAPFIGDPGEWDCSDFVTRFLIQAGVMLPLTLENEPHLVTPSELAKALGVR